MTCPAAAGRGGNGTSEQRRRLLRLEISRAASRLFWEYGVAATSGDRIAEAVGLSTRTVWRHFRNKESCAEPIVTQGVEREMRALRSWPRHLSLESHLTAEAARYENAADADAVADAVEQADTLLAVRMIRLAEHEPSIRTAWLMAGDQVARELTGIVARRLCRPADDLEVRLHAAAASAAIRVVHEEFGAAATRGGPAGNLEADVIHRLARAVRDATGGTIGDAVGSLADGVRGAGAG
ncbi:TetR/AcrR family transcriptional regulator [Streptomyces sp. NPDC091272]|uniref:TetR/AcrR family transcriptional regulator n=1 Tax=Streptomyces sp. NPDC091272 TaxID=3365981 RepID=UPI003822DFD5